MNTPETDGVDHINVYSKGKTKLGQFLSNFAQREIITEDGEFNSIEGYWYWLSCRNEKLRKLSGAEAKFFGRKVGAKDWLDSEKFKRKIKSAINIKIYSHLDFLEEFTESTLPFTHYYVFRNQIKNVPEGKWIIEHLESFRKELKNDRYYF